MGIFLWPTNVGITLLDRNNGGFSLVRTFHAVFYCAEIEYEHQKSSQKSVPASNSNANCEMDGH